MSTPTDRVAVVGAGCSTLISELIRDGATAITAVDISAVALDRLRSKLEDDTSRQGLPIEFVVSNVLDFERSDDFDIWHDRATFHFLTDPLDQQTYASRVAAAVRIGGYFVLSGFAPDGPEQCSGLEVARHHTNELVALFGEHFDVVESSTFDHTTPWGSQQRFSHHVLRRK